MNAPDDDGADDHCVAATHAIIDIFAPLLREEEKREAREMVYAACRAMLEAYRIHSQTGAARLKPGRN